MQSFKKVFQGIKSASAVLATSAYLTDDVVFVLDTSNEKELRVAITRSEIHSYCVFCPEKNYNKYMGAEYHLQVSTPLSIIKTLLGLY